MNCKKGDYIEWCGGGFVHDHDCGPNGNGFREETQCGFARHSGIVSGFVTIPTLGDDDDIENVLVETEEGLNFTIHKEFIQKVGT